MRRSSLLCALAALIGFTGLAAGAPKRVDPADFPQRGPKWSDPAPQPVKRNPPGAYPAYAQLMGIEGSTTVGFTIDGTGKPQLMILLASSPRGVFDSACLGHVRSFVYASQTKSGVPGAQNRRWSFTCRYAFQP